MREWNMEFQNECRALFESINEAYTLGDASRAAALFSQDAVVSPIGALAISGRDAIESVLSQFFRSARVSEYRLIPIEIESCKKSAHVRGTFRWRCRLNDGNPMNVDGRYAAALRKTEPGWLVHRLLENALPPNR
jgi:uncharacterized protein (TIGR02246 family)